MEIDKMLKHVSDLNEYIAITQKILLMPINSKIQFNMSTVLSLKKVRALEIEYFNKCEGNGAALLLFERMLKLPPSKSWVLLGKELALLLQYWLDAMRKHLIKHNHNWWNFMKLLLNFIQFMRVKDQSLSNILVEYTAECLLDLATGSEPDVLPRLQILVSLNLCCRDCSRDTRKALKKCFEPYFMKLSSLLASCGHWPTQYAIMETLMRWLVARHNPMVRQEAAPHWFPEKVYGIEAVELFLKRDFQNFHYDARDFLNAHNNVTNRVVSVVCRKASIGNAVIASSTENREAWLDVNCVDKSISVVAEPKLLDSLGCTTECSETLILAVDNIQHLEITKDSSGVVLSVYILHAAQLFPCGVEMNGREFKAHIASKHVEKLDRALRGNYDHRYKLLLDLLTLSLSPQDFERKTPGCMEEDTRFSHPIERRKIRSGYMVRSRHPGAWKSPSTASTSSLSQLHEKLAQLPRYNFDKEAVHVYALPELSTVTEVSEPDDRHSFASATTTKIYRPYGVCQKRFTDANIRKERKYQSDGELQKKSKVGRRLSPTVDVDENSTSCLLVATVGSDESVINETLERFNKSKDFQGDNIVDLIVQEALNRDQENILDSGINTGDNRKTQEQENIQLIENTLIDNPKVVEKTCIVISNTTTDESNDVVNNTPLNFVNVTKRKKEFKEKAKVTVENPKERPVFDEQVIENFFTQHLNETQRGEVVISPTLARKINESSSDSEHFDECLFNKDVILNTYSKEIVDINIIECLNCMVNKVCNDLEKCTEMFDKELNNIGFLKKENVESISKNKCDLQEVLNAENVITDSKNDPETVDDSNKENNELESNNNLPLTDSKKSDKNTLNNKEKTPPRYVVTPKRTIKLRYPTKKAEKTRANPKKKNKKAETKAVSTMPPTMAARNTTDEDPKKENRNETIDSPTNKSDYSLPLARRKRKLYSPKEGDMGQRQNKQSSDQDEDNDFKVSKIKSPHFKGTSYKDIEEDRQKLLTKPRTRKSSKTGPTLSPRTKNINDIFDHLKDKIESNDSVIFADKKLDRDLAVYNFTSDSEDEDFKKKKIEVQKRFSSTTIASGDSLISTRHGRTVNRINYSESRSSDEVNKKSVLKPKGKRRKRQTKAQQLKKEYNLVDERMRKATPEELNTSLIIEKPLQKPIEEPKLILNKQPVMIAIPDESSVEFENKHGNTEKNIKKNKRTQALSLKKEKTKNKSAPKEIIVDDGRESPLPGLLVETMPRNRNDNNDSISVNMLQKMQRIHHEGPETSINETNTTQNLIGDLDKIICSSPPMNITEEFNKIESETIMDETNVQTRPNKRATTRKDEPIILEQPNFKILRRIKKEHNVKSNKQKNRDSTEIIEISYTEDKSDKSISTVGDYPIRAHCDSDEAPPDPKLLTQNYEHRDIEIEDLDQSIKDYFNKLRSEVVPVVRHKSSTSDDTPKRKKEVQLKPKEILPVVTLSKLSIDDISTSDDTLRRKKEVQSNPKEKSPVVSLSRLSFDDISKWLPSRRNSDTNSSYSAVESEKRPNFNVNLMTHSKNHSDKNPKEIEPAIENFDDIISEINTKSGKKYEIKSKKHSIKEQSKNESKISKPKDSDSNNAGDKSPIDISRNFKTPEKLPDKRVKDTSPKPKKWLRSHNEHDTPVKPNTPQEFTDKHQKIRKSVISPIKLFEDIFPSTANEQSEDENDSVPNASERYKDKKLSKVTKNLKEMEEKENFDTSSPVSKISTSTRINADITNRLKRKSENHQIGHAKRRLLDNTVAVLSESEHSSSSVMEWFRKNTPMSRAENMNASFTEAIQNVMEKLDTTLAEIHQHTSKNFIHMFVNAQNRLAAERQERRQMFRAVASDILKEVVKVVDAKFAEIDQRSQEMNMAFMKQLKTQALELIRDDCKKKQVMVSLLREDVQAVLDFMNKAQTDNC
ncbi:hypothetical protein evm_010216 [Chilo suppressalis]|nr:hypothetical protein evm_010216 [Chilo suppressalis]